MNYEEFKNEFVDALQERLYERGNEVSISITNVEKTNESYEAITITPAGSNIGMNLNLEVFAEAYENGVPFDEIVEQVTHKVEEHLSNMPTFDIQALTDYEQMKDKLSMEVVASDRNAELLTKVPHQEMEDMAVMYRFVMESDEAGRASILITNELIDRMGVTSEQLHADALENAPEIRPAVIKGMNEVMIEMMGPDAAAMLGMDELPQDEKMFVATVPDKVAGAGVIAYQNFMDEAAERIGGDFFILPSSTNEVLLVKDDGEANFRDLKAMVEEVNATQVPSEEKLNTKQKVVEFVKELSIHAEKRITMAEDKLEALVEKYYKNQRVSYSRDLADEIAKIMSWIDCLEFLQKHFDGKTKAYGVKLCFEYNTPDNAWLDVVALDYNRITILEFKSGENDDVKTLVEYEEQLDEYCNKMSHANVNIWKKFESGLTARGFLVYTNEKMKNVEMTGSFVRVCDAFEDVADSFNGYMDDSTESEVMNFEPDFDSSTLSAFVEVLNGRVLDNIYIPDMCKARCVEIIDAGADKREPKVNIVFVNGKPGAGKTGVALALVSEYMQRREKGLDSLKIKYATGNGNLYSLFTQAAKK